MNSRVWKVPAGLCVLALASAATLPGVARAADAAEKPPLYTYVSNWAIPRARWADMEKAGAADDKILDKHLAAGSIVGYGDDVTLVHQADGGTHDNWWQAMSMAALFNVLDEFYKSGTPTSPVLSSATKHWDSVWVSRYYNWHSGARHGAYTHVASYKLKADAPDDAVDQLSKAVVVPMLEKLLADGVLIEYEVDEQAIHTEAPGTFLILYIAPDSSGLDKVGAALRETLKANPLAGPAFGSMVDFTAHRDELSRTNVTYK
ncbi:MAG TPA: hypothetical protein VMT29_17275 [Steroidobacteraceae bacterium]|nr:hypothetical protein [Steroidobacteraceae bacterium]